MVEATLPFYGSPVSTRSTTVFGQLLSLFVVVWVLLNSFGVLFHQGGKFASINKLKLRDVQFTMGIVVETKPKPTWQEACKQKLNFDPALCPHCKVGHLHTVSTWSAHHHQQMLFTVPQF